MGAGDALSGRVTDLEDYIKQAFVSTAMVIVTGGTGQIANSFAVKGIIAKTAGGIIAKTAGLYAASIGGQSILTQAIMNDGYIEWDNVIAATALGAVMGGTIGAYNKYTKFGLKPWETVTEYNPNNPQHANLQGMIDDSGSKTPYKIRESGNRASATIDIDELPQKKVLSSSQLNEFPTSGKIVDNFSPDDWALDIPTKHLPYSSQSNAAGKAIERYVDTEYKILNNIADDLINNGIQNPTGTITILTERFPCPSCLEAARAFKEMFPNVVIEFITGQK